MVTVDADALEPFATTLLETVGATPEQAADVAESLVLADVRGHTSHGVLRIPLYARMIAEGGIDPTATPVLDRDAGATATIDGRLTFGHVVGRRAVGELVPRAREHGIATVGVRNATHLGRVGEWAERTAEAGLVFAAFVHVQGGALSVAAAGTADRRFGTNPLIFAVPTFGALPFPILLDMATSQVAHGKIDEYHANKDPLPDGWAVAADGSPTTDPADVKGFEMEDIGALLPLGGTTSGYKGTGLAIIAELFGGIVGAAPIVGQTDPEGWFSNAAALIAIDPERFVTRDALAAKIDSLAAHLRSATPRDTVSVGAAARGDEPLLPGEAEYLETEDRLENGIPLPPRVVESLVDLADEHNVPVPPAFQ